MAVKQRIVVLGVALLLACLGIGPTGVGQVASTVLGLPPGVAQLGAGGTGLSVVSGAETLFYNPAGLADVPGISCSSSLASHMGVATYSSFVVSFGGLAIGIEMLNSGSIPGYDAEGNPTGDLSFGNTAYFLGFGIGSSQLAFLKVVPFAFSLGAELKVITAHLGETKGGGFAFDLGARAQFPDVALGPIAFSEPAIGLTASNLFGSVSYGDTQETFAMDVAVGASARLAGVVRVAADVHAAGGLGVGFTYTPIPTLALRLGMMAGGEFSITAGIGLNVQGFLIDYAFISHTLGAAHRIGLTLDFSALDIGALGNSLRRILP
jgi:hypothetical protein